MSNWKVQPYLYKEFPNFKLTPNIACFDIDQTIIEPKSKYKFPINKDDWVLLYKNKTKEVLEKLIREEQNYCVIFISNQAGLKTQEQINSWTEKIDDVVFELNIPVRVYASLGKDIYRKPFPTIWNLIREDFSINKIKINYEKTYYCGDAAGRVGDHSQSDYKFALNCGLRFELPETIFSDKIITLLK